MGPMMRIAALVHNEKSRRKLQEAFQGVATLHLFRSGHALTAAIAHGGINVMITELRDPEGHSLVATIRGVHEQHPRIPIIAYTEFTPKRARDVLLAADAGVRELIIRDYDDSEPMARAVLRNADAEALAARVLSEVRMHLPESTREFVEFCFRNAQHGVKVSGIAAHLRANRKTLRNRLTAAHLPSPHKIVGWSRLILAVHLLNVSGRPVEKIARDLNFPSGAALRNMLKRYIGLSPYELKHRGGVAQMIHGFQDALDRAGKRRSRQ
jgi:AraC-like DNA-binding protein